VAADVNGKGITINGFTSVQNNGTLQATSGGQLSVAGLSGSIGTVLISDADSALSLDGTNYTVDSSFAVSDNQSLTLGGSWSAAANVSLSADNATLSLGTPGDHGV